MIRLCMDVESLRVKEGGSAAANIWIELDEISFPSKNWSDFAVIIMAWWSEALLRLIRNESDREIVDFMDGPYAVEISRVANEILLLRALEGDGRNREVAAGRVIFPDFGHDFVCQSRRLLDQCKVLKWWSADAEILSSRLGDLVPELLKAKARSLLEHPETGVQKPGSGS